MNIQKLRTLGPLTIFVNKTYVLEAVAPILEAVEALLSSKVEAWLFMCFGLGIPVREAMQWVVMIFLENQCCQLFQDLNNF